MIISHNITWHSFYNLSTTEKFSLTRVYTEQNVHFWWVLLYTHRWRSEDHGQVVVHFMFS